MHGHTYKSQTMMWDTHTHTQTQINTNTHTVVHKTQSISLHVRTHTCILGYSDICKNVTHTKLLFIHTHTHTHTNPNSLHTNGNPTFIVVWNISTNVSGVDRASTILPRCCSQSRSNTHACMHTRTHTHTHIYTYKYGTMPSNTLTPPAHVTLILSVS